MNVSQQVNLAAWQHEERDTHGRFVANRGRNKDFEISDTMYRPPKQPALSSLNPTGGLFVDYNPQARATAPLGPNLTTLAETQGKDPSTPLRIYRGAPAGQQGIVPGDFVTDNPQLARDYAGSSKILSLDTTYGDVLDDRTEPGGGEYIYRPAKTMGEAGGAGEDYPGQHGEQITNYWKSEVDQDAKQNLNLAGASYTADDYLGAAEYLRRASMTAQDLVDPDRYEKLANNIESDAMKSDPIGSLRKRLDSLLNVEGVSADEETGLRHADRVLEASQNSADKGYVSGALNNAAKYIGMSANEARDGSSLNIELEHLEHLVRTVSPAQAVSSGGSLRTQMQDFVRPLAAKVPGMLGGGKEDWNGQIGIEPQLSTPFTLAELGWDRTMKLREDVAKSLQTSLSMKGEPVNDPGAFSVPLHELIHGVVQEGSTFTSDRDAYQDPAQATIEEGFTELGTVHHMPDWLDAVGVADRPTQILSSIDGSPVPNPDWEHGREALHNALRDEAARVRVAGSHHQQQLWDDAARHVDAAADDIDNGNVNDALDELDRLQHLGDKTAADNALKLKQAIQVFADIPQDKHATMGEYARRLQDPARIDEGNAWGHYPGQTRAAQQWVQQVAQAEAHAAGRGFDARGPGSPDWKRVVELSDEINRQGTSRKLDVMAQQVARLTRRGSPVSYGEGWDSLRENIRDGFQLGSPSGKDAFRNAMAALKGQGVMMTGISAQVLDLGWEAEARNARGEWEPSWEAGRIRTDLIPTGGRGLADRGYPQSDLVESIRRNGVEEPVALDHGPDGLSVANGLHRVIAAKEAGATDIPVIVQHYAANPRRLPLRGRKPASYADWHKALTSKPVESIRLAWEAWRTELRDSHGRWTRGATAAVSAASVLHRVKAGLLDSTGLGYRLASPEIHAFTAKAAAAMPHILGGGTQGYSGKVFVADKLSQPGALAQMEWNGDMTVRSDVADTLQQALTSDAPSDPGPVEDIEHELIHGVGATGSYRGENGENQQAYQDLAKAQIEEGFTELGAIQHAGEFFAAMGLDGKPTTDTAFDQATGRYLVGKHSTYAENAAGAADPQNILGGYSWGHYASQVIGAYGWAQQIAEMEGAADKAARIIELSDQVNQRGTAGKVDVMASQALSAAARSTPGGWRGLKITPAMLDEIRTQILDGFLTGGGTEAAKRGAATAQARLAALAAEQAA